MPFETKYDSKAKLIVVFPAPDNPIQKAKNIFLVFWLFWWISLHCSFVANIRSNAETDPLKIDSSVFVSQASKWKAKLSEITTDHMYQGPSLNESCLSQQTPPVVVFLENAKWATPPSREKTNTYCKSRNFHREFNFVAFVYSKKVRN